MNEREQQQELARYRKMLAGFPSEHRRGALVDTALAAAGLWGALTLVRLLWHI